MCIEAVHVISYLGRGYESTEGFIGVRNILTKLKGVMCSNAVHLMQDPQKKILCIALHTYTLWGNIFAQNPYSYRILLACTPLKKMPLVAISPRKRQQHKSQRPQIQNSFLLHTYPLWGRYLHRIRLDL